MSGIVPKQVRMAWPADTINNEIICWFQCGFNTVSGRLTGLWTTHPSFGWWVPVSVADEDRAKALAVWWNATPARLMLLNRRGKNVDLPNSGK